MSNIFRVASACALVCLSCGSAQAQIGPYNGGSTLSYCSASDESLNPVGEGPWISGSQAGSVVTATWGGDGWNKWHFRWGHVGGGEEAHEYGGGQKQFTINERGFCQRLVLKIQGCVNHILGHDRCSAFQQANFTTDPQRASGGDTCARGFVWREAYPGDHVCVDPAARSQAATDNARHQLAPCPSPLVPRKARQNDAMCVAQTVAADAQRDNGQICRRLVRCP